MEGIPAPDVADYKRHKEIELSLATGRISQPQPKCPKIENRLLSGDELHAQLEAHKALMGASSDAPVVSPAPEVTATVYNAPPTTYATPPAPTPGIPPLGACLSRSSRHFSTAVHARCSASRTFPRRPSNGSFIPQYARISSWSPSSWLSYAPPWLSTLPLFITFEF
ncbi:hypothetical protein EDD16DRAFT_521489 [Pisolithus croceorrhizus]|nr:hypothetical protein EDD16DRAFT_521489 [Pisolithus croceorrhizus]KAI6130097.1 hypothetical protein EV401DRAFT_649808 [Pisolithus croceorrhizus]KAI6160440.1 hypothetical protein EDD17DRAFT_809766 [Pisolithus thermaeus]